MKLWDVLSVSTGRTGVDIYESNLHDQNIPIFDGTVMDARQSTAVFVYLNHEIDLLWVCGGRLIIFVRNRNYLEEIELQYPKEIVAEWERDTSMIPWRSMHEIERMYTDVEPNG